MTFREEYMALLNKFEIAFDDRYVFEFYEWLIDVVNETLVIP
jgi:hypothetical protein